MTLEPPIIVEPKIFGPKDLLPEVEQIARDAGAKILEFYHGTARTEIKADGSPVTEADTAAEKIILPRLAELLPGVPIVSEEAVSDGYKPDVRGGAFWTVDPLDGTKEFIDKTGAFAVAIALVIDHKPVLGVIYHPALDIMYVAAGSGTAAKIGPDGIRVALNKDTAGAPIPPDNDDLRVVVNEPSADMPKVKGYLSAQFGKAARIDPKPGVLRACQVAENTADVAVIYPHRRDGRTKWWDVAPGHAIVEAAGGKVEGADGKPITYDALDFQVPPVISMSPRRLAADKADAAPPKNI